MPGLWGLHVRDGGLMSDTLTQAREALDALGIESGPLRALVAEHERLLIEEATLRDEQADMARIHLEQATMIREGAEALEGMASVLARAEVAEAEVARLLTKRATSPSDDREALALIIGRASFEAEGYEPLGDEATAASFSAEAKAVLAAGFRRQGPFTEAQVEAGARAILAGEGIEPQEDGTYWGESTWAYAVKDARAVLSSLEAARDA